MVSNASDDLPDPLTPVTIVNALWGMSKSMFFRLWTRTPRTTMLSFSVRFNVVVMNLTLYNGGAGIRGMRPNPLADEILNVVRCERNLTHLTTASQRFQRPFVDFKA